MKLFKGIKIKLFLAYAFVFLLINADAKLQTKRTVSEGKYSYEYVENDPLKARIYTLENGLKVYITVNRELPVVQTFIAVATGSKNDPHDAQGLSHYLEHMLFKGTDKFGTKDYEKEKPLLDTITSLYEQRRKLSDPDERKALYHKIDSISFLASDYAIANEYDKMIASIGAKGTNAYTSLEQTVYVNEIPSNQLKKWLEIESERFRNPVMRLFHTELEAVYEEKNISLDDDNSKVWEVFYECLFQKHTYGTQTTIGTVEQLKNPSVQKILDYYNERYVPNNMAICLSGDLDPDKTIALIDEYFGSYKRKEVPPFNPPIEDPVLSPVEKTVYGPSQEFVRLGFRFPGAGTREADMLVLLDNILSNGTAGLIDINLNQDQKIIDAYSGTDLNKDYSVFYLGGKPREGQSLEDVRNLLLNQIELVKEGKFPDWLMPAIIANIKLSQIKSFQDNSSRADEFVTSFINGIPWEDYIFNADRLSAITKEDIVKFTNENFGNNYVIIYKKTGEDKSVEKVEKPEISPVKVNRDDASEFLDMIMKEPSEEIQPVFADYKNDIREFNLNNSIPVFYKKNNDNELYELYYLVDIGTSNDDRLNLAVRYMNYLGTSEYSPPEFKEEFYKLASSYSVSVSEDQLRVSLSGLNDNFDKAVALLDKLFSDPKGSSAALDNLVKDILTERENAKLSKRTILWGGMMNYAKYGKINPFTYRLSEEELKKIKPSEILNLIRKIMTYKQKILYYGPQSAEETKLTLETLHKTPGKLKSSSENVKFNEMNTDKTRVYAVNYDMQQAEILMLSRGTAFDKNAIPVISLYNQYFDGGMQSVLFQEMRESKALAYDTYSSYSTTTRLDRSDYLIGYIGTQADKLSDAMAGMTQLFRSMPESEVIFLNSKTSLLKKIQTERFTGSGVLFSYEAAKKLGLDYDIRKDIYTRIPSMSFQDIKNFQNKFVRDNKFVIMVLGDLKKLDMKTLEKYGEVKILTLKDIFGF